MNNLTDPRVQQQRPPLPDPGDEARREHSRQRRRILEGWWRQDLDERIGSFFSQDTAARLGFRDLSRNPLRALVDQLSKLYAEAPTVEHQDVAEGGLDDFRQQLRAAELWSVLGRNQRQVVGMREGLVRVAWTDSGLQFRVVPSDMVWASATPDRPADPAVVVEARIRTLERQGKREARWTWDVLDVRDPQEPSFKVVIPDGPDPSKAQDISTEVLGGSFSGGDYPYILGGTNPVLPYVLYHAEGGGSQLWDAFTGAEMVDLTLTVAALNSFLCYAIRDASHPIRGLSGGSIRGVNVKGQSARREVPNDPTSMLMIDSDTGGPVQALQWAAGCDPERLQMAIQSYEHGGLIASGVSPADLQQSGASSGYAISLKREFIRERTRAMMPQFEDGDRRVLALAASLSNAMAGTSLPEDGYNLRYSQIALTTEERKARLEEAQAGIALGTRSIVDVILAESPGWTREEAVSYLERVRQERALYPAAGGVTSE